MFTFLYLIIAPEPGLFYSIKAAAARAIEPQ